MFGSAWGEALWYWDSKLTKSNAQLAERAVHILRELDIEPAIPDEAWAMLALQNKK